MQAIQYYHDHPALRRHHFYEPEHEERDERDYFKTPEKRTKARDYSPPKKPSREDILKMEELQPTDELARRILF